MWRKSHQRIQNIMAPKNQWNLGNLVVTKKLKITRQRIMILKKALVPATRFWTTKSVFFGVSPPLRKWTPDEVLLWLEGVNKENMIFEAPQAKILVCLSHFSRIFPSQPAYIPFWAISKIIEIWWAYIPEYMVTAPCKVGSWSFLGAKFFWVLKSL